MGDWGAAQYEDPWQERGSPRESRVQVETATEIEMEVETKVESKIEMEIDEEPTEENQPRGKGGRVAKARA